MPLHLGIFMVLPKLVAHSTSDGIASSVGVGAVGIVAEDMLHFEDNVACPPRLLGEANDS
jgi:hypothetical protein